MSDLRAFYGPNAGYVLDLYERYLREPGSVDPSWQTFFQSFTPPAPTPLAAPGAAAGAPAGFDVSLVVGAHELGESLRARGHTAARVSPLGGPEHPDPSLSPEAHGLREGDLQSLPAAVVGGPAAQGAGSAREAVDRLRAIYSDTTGYEFEHLADAGEREWLRDAVENGRFRPALDAESQRALLRRLSQVEGFEKYLHKAFFGQKRFSIEGTDTMVPILDEVIRAAGSAGANDVVIGMAHRGRLNVLTHVLEKPYALMVGGFAGAGHSQPLGEDDLTGDVKYHMGWRTTRQVGGRDVRVTLSP
ncbi:MAG TPA: hypothetical protein VFI96_00005, partial [Longimicrobiaceae bacterium]|nr:hypothetical protein [Longimicrobiaceae bacterium]